MILEVSLAPLLTMLLSAQLTPCFCALLLRPFVALSDASFVFVRDVLLTYLLLPRRPQNHFCYLENQFWIVRPLAPCLRGPRQADGLTSAFPSLADRDRGGPDSRQHQCARRWPSQDDCRPSSIC